MAVLVVALVVGIVRHLLGYAPNSWDTWVNVLWICYDLAVMSVIIQAALFKGSHMTEHGGRPPWTPARLRRNNKARGTTPLEPRAATPPDNNAKENVT
jgi:hypothetical protein